ncbi:hypothetical protein EVAR_40181_1 [Eumeta japonica]|uniref:Uncharacterized protein n=1 Tax=Eumeta variegata TaxID=151549 RepID=A0A4C1XLE2_EUMVA|nr:hypothetical protein EVAR_40181_1 [Eumeta japonica]
MLYMLIETASEETNSTTSAQDGSRKLSGIPQIDYIYDPNLPRELNGYNLSEYPFYETVPKPETMDFKCDGLHDGFYASVPHKCQVSERLIKLPFLYHYLETNGACEPPEYYRRSPPPMGTRDSKEVTNALTASYQRRPRGRTTGVVAVGAV